MIEKNGEGLRVTGPMLIGEATGLLESGRGLLRAAGANQSVVVDLSGVDSTDSSALGVVFGWLRTARENGISLRLVNPPASMMSQAELYGVSDSLPLA